MPPRRAPQYDDYRSAVESVILASSDADYLDQLIPALKDATLSNRTQGLMQSFAHFAEEREQDIEQIGLTKHDEFLNSVSQLQNVREGTVALTREILDLNQSIQASTQQLAAQKEALVDVKAVKENMEDAKHALLQSLTILQSVNTAHNLVKSKSYYAGLKALDDLQNEFLIPTIQNKYATQYKLAAIIQTSIPASQKTVSDSVMADLNQWLFRIRETSQFLGEVAFYHTDLRRARQKERMEVNSKLRNFKLNSAIELVFDESEDFDVLDNDELAVDFRPLFECMHIQEALGRNDTFKVEYAATRKQQKDLLLPSSVSLKEVGDDENGDPRPAKDNSLSSLLEGIAGFAIIEKATLRRAHNLRSPVDVDELWDSMCQTAITLITKALDTVDEAEVILKIKGTVALFIQTMDGWGYSVATLDNFLLVLFDKYAELLKKKFSDDFEHIVGSDDYMPMSIKDIEEYDAVLNLSWYTPEKPRDQLSFPCVVPFSQMYPMCCIDIRNFLNQIYFFSDDHFQHPNVIDEILKKSIDELLTDKVCKTLVASLSSQYLGQIVQIFINLSHFEYACRELEQLLIAARSSSSAGGPIVLRATEEFSSNIKTAENRIFELVNSKIDDLIETAEYDWMATTLEKEPSNYMQTLTNYLENIMSSTLLGLPPDVKNLIYFDSLSHAAQAVLALPLSPSVTKINPNGVAALAIDVDYLVQFVSSLGDMALLQQLDELQQTILLMQTENSDEFYDNSIRNKKFGLVNAQNGAELLNKLTYIVQSPTRATDRLANFSSRFGRG